MTGTCSDLHQCRPKCILPESPSNLRSQAVTMTDYRERSRSPKRVSRKVSRSHDRENSGSRSRSPRRSGHQKRHYHVHKHEVLVPTRALPLNAQTLSRHNLSTHWPLFGLYLDVQKNLDIDEISENEIKGRWKSFVKKW